MQPLGWRLARNSKAGESIGKFVYNELLQAGKLNSKTVADKPKGKDDVLTFAVLVAALGWLFLRKRGLYRSIPVLAISVLIGGLAGLIFASAGLMTLWAIYTVAATYHFGALEGRAEARAEISIDRAFG